jgi:myo-inositol-1(or 4)-monophosphatase
MSTPRNIAIAAAREAGKFLLQLSQKEIKYQMKSVHDILAEGDLQSEKIIIEKIRKAFPDHSILSEEKGDEVHKKEFLWVIDPIDGTINFARKIEEYAISIALCQNKQIILGVIYQPIINKLYVAEKGKGAYLNNNKISASHETDTNNALAATDNSSELTKRIKNFNILSKICSEVRHIRIFGSCALHMTKLAEGKLDFYFKTSFNFWDFAAGIILLEEAGGKITDFTGKAISKESKNIIASNGVIHNAALNLILA